MKYFKFNYKQMLMPTVFLTIIGTLVYIIPIMFAQVNDPIAYRRTANLVSFAIFLIIATIFIPVYEFSSLKTTKGSDLYYALPLTKRHVHFILFLKGLMELIVSYSVLYILGVLITFSRGFNFDYEWYLPVYFLGLIGLITYYAFNTVIFLRSNRIVDGILFILLYILAPFLVLNTITYIFGLYPNKTISFFPFNHILELFNYFDHIITKRYIEEAILFRMQNSLWIWSIVGLVVGTFGLVFTKDLKPEDVYQVSNTWIGYKILIPIYLITLTVFLRINFIVFNNIPWLALFFMAGYVGYVIHQRTFKIKWYYFVIIFASTFVGILINAIATMNGLFIMV